MYDLNGNYNGGYVKDQAAINRLKASVQPLFDVAPHFEGDGVNQDLMPYKAFREVEILNPDGSMWKKKGDEPPYKPQVGNNCTSEGFMHAIDLLQAMDIADPITPDVPIFQRTCVEACYAFGLYEAGMRGDNGCSGAGMAKAAAEIGVVSYFDVAPPYDEDRTRLKSWASNPKSIVDKYKDKAATRKIPTCAQITSVNEAQACLANRGVFTIASNVGFATPRNDKGICQRRSRWDHQMFCCGRIISDGTPSFVIMQSWGANQPSGPTPFDLLTFTFRIVDADMEIILSQDDSWMYRSFPGYTRTPLASKWTYQSWA